MNTKISHSQLGVDEVYVLTLKIQFDKKTIFCLLVLISKPIKTKIYVIYISNITGSHISFSNIYMLKSNLGS